MKKNALSIVILFLSLLHPLFNYSQERFSPQTGTYISNDSTASIVTLQTTENAEIAQGGIPCNPNTFWANNSNGSIIEYNINGSTITPTGVSYSIPYYKKSVIYANNPSGTTAFSPSFYSTEEDTLSVYTGTGYQVASLMPGIFGFNGGGNGDHIFFGGDIVYPLSGSTMIFYHNVASGFTDTVYKTDQGRKIAIADQAVDDNGNCYFLTGPGGTQCDSLLVVSPTGAIVKKYPLSLSVNNAYGSFIKDNVFYIGFGSSNTVYPSKLLPITFTFTTAVIGNPINFPNSSGNIDLESCNQGLPLGLTDPASTSRALTIFPSPARGQTEVLLPASVYGRESELKIYDLTGRLVKSQRIQPAQNKLLIDLRELYAGIYFIVVEDSENLYVARLLVER